MNTTQPTDMQQFYTLFLLLQEKVQLRDKIFGQHKALQEKNFLKKKKLLYRSTELYVIFL